MSDRLLKESDVLKIAFQLPLVINSAFADAVKALPSADRPQGWILCSERMPEEEGMFLVTARDYIFDTTAIVVGTCYFNPDYKFTSAKEILAWMPLPEPWKGADDDSDNI